VAHGVTAKPMGDVAAMVRLPAHKIDPSLPFRWALFALGGDDVRCQEPARAGPEA
jgi:hypothetical protein